MIEIRSSQVNINIQPLEHGDTLQILLTFYFSCFYDRLGWTGALQQMIHAEFCERRGSRVTELVSTGKRTLIQALFRVVLSALGFSRGVSVVCVLVSACKGPVCVTGSKLRVDWVWTELPHIEARTSQCVVSGHGDSIVPFRRLFTCSCCRLVTDRCRVFAYVCSSTLFSFDSTEQHKQHRINQNKSNDVTQHKTLKTDLIIDSTFQCIYCVWYGGGHYIISARLLISANFIRINKFF